MSPETRARREALHAALAELVEGCTSPADIARKLTDTGCRGRREDCYDCPVALWLVRRLPGERKTVLVSPEDVKVTWESAGTFNGEELGEMPVYEDELTADLPPLLVAFIEAFDIHRRFPELDDVEAGTQ